MNRLIYLWIFVMLVPAVLGIETHDVTYTINDVVGVRHLLTTSNESSIELFVPDDAYNFDVAVDDEPAEFNLSRTDDDKEVLIPLSPDSQEIEVSYLTGSFLEEGKHSYFVGSLRTAQYTDELSLDLILPETALLARPLSASSPPVSPSPVSVETGGRQITVKWIEQDMKPDEIFTMFVVYEDTGGVQWNLILITLITIIFAGGFYFYIRYHKVLPIKKKLFSHLLEPEQAVVDVLLKADDNIMWQKELQIALGFTKSRLSRTIRNMEQRGLLKKIPYGATNKIELITKKESEEEEK
ncbi:MAG: helix-turn-helix transcriptional regulator [Candidatus Woesearchaeota archaeon]